MSSDVILQAALIVLASIFLVMIYAARSKQRSKAENWFLLIAGGAFALLGVALVFVGMLAMGKGHHGSPVPGAVICLISLLMTAVSVIIAYKARVSLHT